MFTDPVGPVEVFLTGPKPFWDFFYWPGAKGPPLAVGLHTGTRVPIGTEIHFEKNQYLPVSLRTGTKRHRFVFEYRFVSTD